MDILALNILLIVSLSVSRLSDAPPAHSVFLT